MKYTRILVLLLLTMSVMLVACGGDDDSDNTDNDTAADPTPTQETLDSQAASADDAQNATSQRMILATTNSLNDSGLLDAIVSDFEAEFNAQVGVVTVENEEVLELAMNGDADAFLLGDSEVKDEIMDTGNGSEQLDVMVEGEDDLASQYSIIITNSAVHEDANFELASQFAAWLTSVETQQMIEDYTVDGEQLFSADSTTWRDAQDGD